MLIRCKAIRPGGSLVEFGRQADGDYRAYHFKGAPEGPHTAEVDDDGDVATLLAIVEGYEPHGARAFAELKRKAEETEAAKERAAAEARAQADAEAKAQVDEEAAARAAEQAAALQGANKTVE